jgi:UDP-N-acetylmuramate dehydrogenase
MEPAQNISLKDHSTMRLGGNASYLLEVSSRMEVADACRWAAEHQQGIIMVGDGSNIYWRDEGFQGLILVNKIKRFELFEEDAENTYVTIGAGENWDSVVARCVEAGLTGIEALSLIPGTAGATPVQNVGAYGQEIAHTLVSVEAMDARAGKFVNLPASDCAFGYRTSRFKTTDKHRFLITAITLHLSKGSMQPPFYNSLQNYLDTNKLTDYSPKSIRAAVIAIRQAKLPDPATVSNNGSFFANPIITTGQLAQLQSDYPDIPHWRVDDLNAKIPAAWLLEHAGFKDYHDSGTGMATWPTQPLVLVNEHAESTANLESFKQKIITAIKQKFQITLEQEPELSP